MKSNRLIDLKGKKFGKLTVICRTKNVYSHAGSYWDCDCECGETKSYRSDVLRKTNIKSCGCTFNHVKIGDRIGKLVVIKKLGRIHKRKNKKGRGRSIYWECLCDCDDNKKIILSSHSIKEGNHTSCGCLLNPRGEKHPKYKGYKELSGRFFNRIEKGAEDRDLLFKITKEQIWDLFEKQKRKCALSGLELQFGIESKNKEKKKECTASLDRIDNTKGYVISNVQWIHKYINIMKRNHTQEYFIKICKQITINN